MGARLRMEEPKDYDELISRDSLKENSRKGKKSRRVGNTYPSIS